MISHGRSIPLQTGSLMQQALHPEFVNDFENNGLGVKSNAD